MPKHRGVLSRTLLTSLFISLCVYKLAAQKPISSESEQVKTKQRPVIGLALEGGGALGLAHIGVYEWMQEHHVPVDRIAGTSMGALVGSLIASGHTAPEMQGLTENGRVEEVFALKPSLSHLSARRRQDREELPQAISIGLRGGGVSLGNALITDDRLNALLSKELLGYSAENLSFDNLPIPFRCVATDLTTLRPTVFKAGSLPFAVRASISIPGIFPPVYSNGDVLVDGAIVDNLPTDVLRNDLHADVIIAVHLADSSFHVKDANSMLEIFARAFQAGTNRDEQISRAQADLEISPEVFGFSSTDYGKGRLLIKAGYDAAERQKTKLLTYALTDTEWEAYIAKLSSRKRDKPGRIDVVQVEGPDAIVSAKIAHRADVLQGQKFNDARVESAVSEVRGDGAFDAYYETFYAPLSPSGTDAKTPAPENGVILHWDRKTDGPPYLLLGTDVVATTSNVTSTVFDLRFVDQNVGGYGSEIKADVRIGYLTHLGTEYYRPLGTGRFYVQPSVELMRQPVYMWQNQKRVSERFLQRAGGGFDSGFTFSRNLQVAAEYRDSTIHWGIKDGADASPTQYLSGVTETVGMRLKYSDRTAEIASPKGRMLDLAVGYLFHTSASSSAPFLRASVLQTFTVSGRNLLSFSGELSSYFRRDLPDPLRFTLGGPTRLYASSVDEYRGTDTVLTRAIYLRRIATLPTGLGQGVYLTGGYEAGEIWSPEQRSVLRQDGVVGLLLSTPVGALTIGGSVGDAGRRKMFFTFGRLF